MNFGVWHSTSAWIRHLHIYHALNEVHDEYGPSRSESDNDHACYVKLFGFTILLNFVNFHYQ